MSIWLPIDQQMCFFFPPQRRGWCVYLQGQLLVSWSELLHWVWGSGSQDSVQVLLFCFTHPCSNTTLTSGWHIKSAKLHGHRHWPSNRSKIEQHAKWSLFHFHWKSNVIFLMILIFLIKQTLVSLHVENVIGGQISLWRFCPNRPGISHLTATIQNSEATIYLKYSLCSCITWHVKSKKILNERKEREISRRLSLYHILTVKANHSLSRTTDEPASIRSIYNITHTVMRTDHPGAVDLCFDTCKRHLHLKSTVMVICLIRVSY